MIRAFHICSRLTVLFMAFVMLSCVEREQLDADERNVMLQVALDVDKGTKATPTDIEKTINSVRIYAYREDTGRQIGHYYRGIASDEPIYMDLALPQRGQYAVEFYVVVNETSVLLSEGFSFTEKMTREKVRAVCFNGIDNSGTIPFYCMHTETINVDNVTPDQNTVLDHLGHDILVQKVTFSLSSSLSKLSVYAAMAEGVAATTVHYVGILKGGLRQHVYFLPPDEDVLADIPSRAVGRDLMVNESVLTKNAAEGSQNSSDYDMLVSDHYISEVEVGSESLDVKTDDRQLTIHVQYSVGEGGELRNGYIYMPEIKRGTHYKILLLITSEGRIILAYTVADWDLADMTELWFDYPSHSVIEYDIDGEKPQAPAQMSVDKPFKGYFRMSYPASETWRPAVLGDNAGRASVKVYRNLEEVTPPVAADPDNWYRIEVTPDPDLEVGKEVSLAITYSPDFSVNSHYEFLLINGSQNNWYWPYEGVSVQDANKVIITVVE